MTYTCFSERRICTQSNPSTVKGIPWYLRPDAPVIYTGAFLIWPLGRVGGQYVTPTPPLGQDMTQGQFLSGVWIQSFPSPILVASPRLNNQSVQLLTHSWRENNWIHTFPKGIGAMWNAISIDQDLNSCRRVHFLRR